MTRVGMHEAKTKLSQLVAAVESGEEVVLERRGVPVARLVAIEKPKRSRAELCGSMKGIWIADDFDELPDDIAEAFGMR
ncbi:type II toxin-antitoxin system prevent-host-death family antitoxin [Baekduia sp.]|jgi:prevent-host-death family protein|uniref:type II toxin-antitoxin system Phd/YefM family antitoxin n=1 Tax=Baekduia sp. TaxID=2600305 RepID=UPI002DF7FC97|nr:type II toxin-antitoxin system prevent-host-death family antitoxin [Baekduia sp.]